MEDPIDKPRTISMSSLTVSTEGSVDSRMKMVRFDPIVKVAMLPWQEREEARKARAGQWKPAPMSDELWDGEFMAFRPAELSPEAFKSLSFSFSRRKSPLPRSFASMFSIATSGSGKLSGVDIVHARARVYAEDFDVDERDSYGHLIDEEMDEQDAHIVMKLSTERVGDEMVLRFAPVDGGISSVIKPFPPPPPGKKMSNEKLTRFVASPPSEPSPSEKAGLIVSDAPKKSSLISAGSSPSIGEPFVCGEGKRNLFLVGEEAIKFEPHDFVDEPMPPKKMNRKKSSILGFLFPGAVRA
jgi:hypothetical protein